MTDEIQTQRLHLRPLTPADATPTYASWLNDVEINQYLETRHHLQSVESCAQFIGDCNGDASCRLFGIFLAETGKHIGNAKIGAINLHHARGELSLFIGEKSLWGRGFAKEVVRALTSYGFDRLALERLQAACYERNTSSLHAFLHCGYVVEGFFRRHAASAGRRTGVFWLGMLRHEFN